MEEFQSQCLDNEPKLRSFLVSPKKAHITLLVLHVEDGRLEEAKSIFEHCRDHFSNDKIFHVEFTGVGAFGNRVLFAKPSGNTERIVRLSETFQAKFSEQNFQCEYKLCPHLTLLKVKAKRKGLKKIPSSSYDGLENYRFGIQSFRTIQLLSMTKPVAEVQITYNNNNNNVLITVSSTTTTTYYCQLL